MVDEKDRSDDDTPGSPESAEQPSAPDGDNEAARRPDEGQSASGEREPDDAGDQDPQADEECSLSGSDLAALRELQRRVTTTFSSPALDAIREQQRRMAQLLSPAALRFIERRRFADAINLPAIEALEEQRRRLAQLADTRIMRAIQEQQRALAELTQGPAFEALRHNRTQIGKLATTPAAQMLAQQQARWRATAENAAARLAVAKFHNTYLAEVRAVAEAVSKIQLDPGWKLTIRSLRASPEVRRWAEAVSAALEAEPGSDSDVEDASEALASSAVAQEVLQRAEESDTTPLEDLIALSSRAFEEASRERAEDSVAPRAANAADAETYRALLKLWGVSNVVYVVLLACLLSGQILVVLVTLAALAQISGYSLKDLIGFLREPNHEE